MQAIPQCDSVLSVFIAHFGALRIARILRGVIKIAIAAAENRDFGAVRAGRCDRMSQHRWNFPVTERKHWNNFPDRNQSNRKPEPLELSGTESRTASRRIPRIAGLDRQKIRSEKQKMSRIAVESRKIDSEAHPNRILSMLKATVELYDSNRTILNRPILDSELTVPNCGHPDVSEFQILAKSPLDLQGGNRIPRWMVIFCMSEPMSPCYFFVVRGGRNPPISKQKEHHHPNSPISLDASSCLSSSLCDMGAEVVCRKKLNPGSPPISRSVTVKELCCVLFRTRRG